MNETEKQSLVKMLELIQERLDRQGRVLDKLVAIQEDRNQHQDALEHIQRQHAQHIKELEDRLSFVRKKLPQDPI